MAAANEARFGFENHHLAEGELAVVDFVGVEAISQPFRFELDLLSKNASVPFSDLIDQPATLTMKNGEGTYPVHGVVADFQQGSPVGDFFGYRAVLVPRLWRLSLTHQSRVFQHLSVPEIVRQVLSEAKLGPNDFRFDLTASYTPRDYCTQYKETDLAFLSRLLEYEGIQFFFEHGDHEEVLVMIDDRSKNPPVPGDDRVAYRPAQGLATPHDEAVREFVFREQMVTGKVVLKDYNYRTPDADLRAESQITDEMPGTYYDYGLHFKDKDTGTRLARVRNEELESQRRVGTGEGTCMRMRAGHTFTLGDHYRLDLNQSYLLTEVTHHGIQRGAVSMQAGAEDDVSYRNTITCIPANVQYRPPRKTPEPKLPGIMTAKVESGGGEYAYLDDEGRYRIKMPFDLAETDQAGASKPIRLAQPYAGADYGMHFPLHADAEMVFACVDGNVDRPLGLSTVPNPKQGSPVKGENHTKNVIETASGNRIEMEDERGTERIKLYSPHKDSLIQLGAPNCPVDGIVSTTKGFSGVHGAEGVYLTAWDKVTDSDWVGKVGSVVVGGAAFITGQALAKRVGKFDVFSKLQTVMTASKGIALAAAAGGAFGFGEGFPGITTAAPGHVRTIANGSIQGLSAAGIAFITGATTEVCAALGVSIASGTGVNVFAATDVIRTVAGKGDIETKAEMGNIRIEADQEIKLRSMSNDIRLLTLKDNTIWVQSNNLIRQQAKKEFEIKSMEGPVRVEAEEVLSLKSLKERVVIEAEKEIVLVCGDSTITISPEGVDINAPNYVEVKSDGSVNAYAGGSSGPALLLGASGSFSVANSVSSYGLDTAGTAKINGTQVDISATALAQVSAPMTKIG